MKELIIRCDHCGKAITGKPYKVCLEQVDRETGDFLVDQTEDQEKVRDMDWCENCFRNLTAFLLDTSHKLLAAPPVLPKEANPEPTQETIAAEPESSGGGTKEEPY